MRYLRPGGASALLASPAGLRQPGLPVKQDAALIENILYSGIWTVYADRMRKERGEQMTAEMKGDDR